MIMMTYKIILTKGQDMIDDFIGYTRLYSVKGIHSLFFHHDFVAYKGCKTLSC